MLLISANKAVRATNVMGASKRLAELVVQAFAQRQATCFHGSFWQCSRLFGFSCAVVSPTDCCRRSCHLDPSEIVRYFMTIPEAAQLVLQAAGLANGGEVFLLDMGEPVGIRVGGADDSTQRIAIKR